MTPYGWKKIQEYRNVKDDPGEEISKKK